MKYTAEIKVEEDFDNIDKLFRATEKEFMSGRASYDYKDGIFIAEANDATALRAVLEAIAKGLKLYEDAGDLDE